MPANYDCHANPSSPATRIQIVGALGVDWLFMQGLDTTIINTALPAIAENLQEDPLRMLAWWWPMYCQWRPVFP